jgi:hypothetical protein
MDSDRVASIEELGDTSRGWSFSEIAAGILLACFFIEVVGNLIWSSAQLANLSDEGLGGDSRLKAQIIGNAVAWVSADMFGLFVIGALILCYWRYRMSSQSDESLNGSHEVHLRRTSQIALVILASAGLSLLGSIVLLGSSAWLQSVAADQWYSEVEAYASALVSVALSATTGVAAWILMQRCKRAVLAVAPPSIAEL